MSKPHTPEFNKSRPFVDDGTLTIFAKQKDGMIVSFEVTVKKKKHVVKVKNKRVLDAFKQVEQLTKHL